MTDPWQPSQIDRYLEAMRRLAGNPKNARFGEVVQQDQHGGRAMKYSEAHKNYRTAAGDQYEQPVQKKCYLRNDAWHLLDKSGALLAVVHPDGTVRHGQPLRAIMEQAAHRRRA